MAKGPQNQKDKTLPGYHDQSRFVSQNKVNLTEVYGMEHVTNSKPMIQAHAILITISWIFRNYFLRFIRQQNIAKEIIFLFFLIFLHCITKHVGISNIMFVLLR